MKYKIMRMFCNSDEIFLDLYNEYFNINIELKFCCYKNSSKYKQLISWLKCCNRATKDITPEEIIQEYEKITITNKINKK